MAILKDPENNETSVLRAMVNFKDLSVLEIGCGEGRLTWRYAESAAQVMAIDPDGDAVEKAHQNMPEKFIGRVQFLNSTIEDFAKSYNGRKFDVAIFSWSL